MCSSLFVSPFFGEVFDIFTTYIWFFCIALAHVLDASISFGIARLMGREHGRNHTSYIGAFLDPLHVTQLCSCFAIILALLVVNGIKQLSASLIAFAYLHLCWRDVPVILIFPPRRVVPGTTHFSFFSFFFHFVLPGVCPL